MILKDSQLIRCKSFTEGKRVLVGVTGRTAWRQFAAVSSLLSAEMNPEPRAALAGEGPTSILRFASLRHAQRRF
jgi:hypothetical protein